MATSLHQRSTALHTEDGSLTVWFAIVTGGLVSLAVLIVVVGGLWSAQTHTQAVADMAALGGADLSSVSAFEAAPETGLACNQAQEVATRNGVHMRRCVVEGADTKVILERAVRLGPWTFTIVAKARAGPP